MKKENGITLVALVISIIVLLILATVSIQTLIGNNGLLTKTETAVKSNKDAQEEEKIKLAVSAAQLAGNGIITTDNLNRELQANFNNEEVSEYDDFYIYKTNKSYKIYKDGRVEEGKLLPDEYQQVEYIESTGTQWIDTKLSANVYNKISIKIEGNFTNFNKGWQYIFGAGDDKSDCKSYILIGRTGNLGFTGQNGLSGNEKKIKESDTQKHLFILDTLLNIAKVDSTSIDLDATGIKPINYNYLLFALNKGQIKDNASFRMYSCEIRRNNMLIRNFIPCYREVDDAVGLYDLFENKFYTNENTSEEDFTAGPDV